MAVVFFISAVFGQNENEARGRVIDGKGDAVAGAEITVRAVARGSGVRYEVSGDFESKVRSGVAGEFVLRGKEPFAWVTVTAEAPGFAKGVFSQVAAGGGMNELRLVEGVSARGILTKEGRPIGGARLGISDAERGSEIYYLNLTVETDAQGRFVFSNLPPRRDYFLYGAMGGVGKDGAVTVRRISTGANGSSMDVSELAVERAFHLDGQIKLADGATLPEKTIVRLGRDGPHDFQETTASADGRFHFENVPAEVVSLAAAIPGHRLSMRNGSLFPAAPNRLLGRVSSDVTGLVLEFEPGETLAPLDVDLFALREEPLRGAEGPGTNGIKVAGAVFEAETKKALAHFSMMEGRIRNGRTNWFPTRRAFFTNGIFSTYLPKGEGYVLEAEGDGYLPEARAAAGTNLVFELKKGFAARGIILKPNGDPAANVTVYLADLFNGLEVEGPPLSLANPVNNAARRMKTNSKGEFAFAPGAEDFAIVVSDEAGFAYERVEELRARPEVKLQAWARVEGKLKIGEAPGTNEVVRLSSMPRPFEWYPRELPAYTVALRTRTDGEGRFVFERVPPVSMEIAHSPAMGDRAPEPIEKSQTRILLLKPGETARVDLGGRGRLVTGRVVVTNYTGAIRWNSPALALETIREGGPSDSAMKSLLEKLVATSVTNTNAAARAKAERDYQVERGSFARATRDYYETESGNANWMASARYLLRFDDDGNFWAVDVPPGKYRVHWMISKNTGLLIAEDDTDVTVPPGSGPVDLGVIKLALRAGVGKR
jgi:hypothetical protein